MELIILISFLVQISFSHRLWSHGLITKPVNIFNDLPISIDWSNITGAASNQGQKGDDVGFAVTECLQAQYEIKTGRKMEKLSVSELGDCVKPSETPDNSWKFIMGNNGICTVSTYPPHSNGVCQKDKCSPIDPIKSYVDVQAINNSTALQYALLSGPVVVGVEADNMAFQSYTAGILSGQCGDKIDHFMLLVGYGQDSKGDKYWKCMNSWGQSWGESGYIRMCRECGKNDGKGECGILMEPTYPILP
eukprot:334112_1